MRLFVDNLTNIDFSYLCPQRGLVGETWLAHIELQGTLDEQGMICDFGLVKKRLREWLDKNLDHCLLVPALSEDITISSAPTVTTVELNNRFTNIRISAPKQAITPVPSAVIDAEHVAHWCEEQLRSEFAQTVEQLRLTFTSEVIDTPYFHYSHGLKKHAGQCQRIAHGHRSKLLVWRDGVLCQQTMREWAEKWRDIYIGTHEDCTADDGESLRFDYLARQGHFSLTIPKKCCYLMDSDTTVEHIAMHLADVISHQHVGEKIRVKAFEGIGKGAIAETQKLATLY